MSAVDGQQGPWLLVLTNPGKKEMNKNENEKNVYNKKKVIRVAVFIRKMNWRLLLKSAESKRSLSLGLHTN